jgi:WD40 repeat protein
LGYDARANSPSWIRKKVEFFCAGGYTWLLDQREGRVNRQVKRILVVLLALSGVSAFGQKPALVAQRGHTSDLLSASFSKDGRFIVTASNDNSARLWDAATGRELRLFEGTLNRVFDAAISPNNAWVVLGDYSEPFATLLDAATGAKVRVFAGHTGSVLAVRFSPDGKTLLTGSADGTAMLWDVATAKPIRTLEGHAADVFSVAFSHDGRLVITGSGDRTAKVWEVGGGEPKTLSGHAGAIKSAAFSPDASLAVTGSQDGTARIWQVATGREVRKLTGHNGSVTTAGFSSDGKQVLTAGVDGTVRLWNSQTGVQTLRFDSGQRAILRASFSPQGDRILTAGGDGTARLWDAKSGKETLRLTGSALGVYCCAFTPDGALAATGGNDNVATLWDVAKGRPIVRLTGHLGWINGIAVSADGKRVITAGEDGTARIWDVESGSQLLKLAGHTGTVNSAAFSPNGRRALTAGRDKTARLWDAATGQEIYTFSHDGPVMSACFSQDGKLVVTASMDGSAKLWDAEKGTSLGELRAGDGILMASFSPNSKQVVTAGSKGNIGVWDIAQKKEIKSFGHEVTARSAVFSKDGKAILTSSGDKTARLWDASSGKELVRYAGHTARVWQAVFSPDGKRVMTAGDDATLRVWDTSSGKELFARLAFRGADDWVVAAPDGGFDGSEGGIKNLHFVRGLSALPLESLYDEFYTPDLAAQSMGRKPLPVTKPKVDIEKAKPAPTVRIVSPQSGASLTSPTLNVEVEAADKGGGIDEIRLYVNGKLVGGSDRKLTFVPKEGETKSKTFAVALAPGLNTLKATAFNLERTESEPAEVKVEFRAAASQPELYILAVGINKYKNAAYNLRFAQPDAGSFVELLEARSKSLFAKVHKTVVLDDKATRASLEAAFADIVAKAKPEDVFVFYYSGHGGMSDAKGETPADFHFVLTDVTQIYGSDDLVKQGFASRRLREFSKQIKALKQLLIIDACQSGGAAEAFGIRGAAEEKAVNELSRSAGLAVLMSSAADQVSKELPKFGHGVFTYALMEALKGTGGVAAPDGRLSLLQIAAYLNSRVPDLTKVETGAAQYPKVFLQGQDFPIAILSSQGIARLFALCPFPAGR